MANYYKYEGPGNKRQIVMLRMARVTLQKLSLVSFEARRKRQQNQISKMLRLSGYTSFACEHMILLWCMPGYSFYCLVVRCSIQKDFAVAEANMFSGRDPNCSNIDMKYMKETWSRYICSTIWQHFGCYLSVVLALWKVVICLLIRKLSLRRK